MHITRTNDSTTQLIKVPIQYAKKDRGLSRDASDPELNKPIALVLPRMSFALTGFEYANDRHLTTLTRVVRKDEDNVNKFRRQFTCAPYDFFFELYVYVNKTEDGTKIIEQITPFFAPEWTSTINIIPDLGIKLDVPLQLLSTDFEDTAYDSNYEESRVIVWTLKFVMKAGFYGPIVSKPIIKVANTQFFMPTTEEIADGVANTNVVGRLTVTPGLDANGNPTSNTEVTIPWNQISVDDDYGFVVENEGIVLSE